MPMNDQHIFRNRREKHSGALRRPWVSGVVLLTLALVTGLWLYSHFQPEARVRRASTKLAVLVQKQEEESDMALALAANRLSQQLEPQAKLSVEGYGIALAERTEIVQLFAQLRRTFARIELSGSRVAARQQPNGEILAQVVAKYRLVYHSEKKAGNGQADLWWRKTDQGWRIRHVEIYLENTESWPALP